MQGLDISKLHPRDQRWVQVNMGLKGKTEAMKAKGVTWTALISKHFLTGGERDALVFVNDDDQIEKVSWEQLRARTNQVGAWAQSIGLKKGDCVNLISMNDIQQVVIALGLAKIGVIASMINYQLMAESLVHCLTISNGTVTIFQNHFAAHINEIRDQVQQEFFVFGGDVEGYTSLEPILSQQPTDEIETEPASREDTLFYIYTSGTTGLPKAVHMSQAKFVNIGVAFSDITVLNEEAVVYCSLPFYHSNALMCCLGSLFIGGGTLAFRSKFSVSKFFSDCIATNAGTVMYIGEVWRYLANSAPSENDNAHNVKQCIGNGLREELWDTVQQRFNIPTVWEFYGATEGFSGVANVHNKKGAVGQIPAMFRPMVPMKIVKCDQHTGELFRNEAGFCEFAETGEPGHYISEMPYSKCYTSEEASAKKLAQNCFAEGDTYFLSGDLLKTDAEGFLYFVDRIGDTFRWKGENVSTREVEMVLNALDWGLQINVYGVQVPGTEGRAGCALIQVDSDNYNLSEVSELCSTHLPGYATPLFIRISTADVIVTGTLKHKKTDPRDEGCDPEVVKDDKLFFLQDGVYVPLDKALYDSIASGDIRF